LLLASALYNGRQVFHAYRRGNAIAGARVLNEKELFAGQVVRSARW
jgi:hypothetical protein